MRGVREMGTVTIDVRVIVTDAKDIVLSKPDESKKGLFLSGKCTDETLTLLREFFEEEIREARGCIIDTSKKQ